MQMIDVDIIQNRSILLVRNAGIGMVFLGLSIILLVASVVQSHEYSIGAILAFIIFTVFIICVFKTNKQLFSLSLLLLWGQWGNMLSNVLLESMPGFILEQWTYSFTNGATVWLLLYSMCLFLPSLIFYRKTSELTKPSQIDYIIGHIFVVFVIVVLSIGIGIWGSPILLDATRFEYWKNIAPAPLKVIYYYLPFASFTVAFLEIHQYLSRKLMILYILTMLTLCILYGEKFSMIFFIVCSMLIPLSWRKGELSKKITSKLVYFICIVALIFSLLVWHYTNQYGIGIEGIFDIITFRIKLQGHLWWGIINIADGTEGWLHFLNAELGSFFAFKDDIDEYGIGLKFLMQLLGDPKLVAIYFEKGINFTMGYPAIVAYSFGLLGGLFFQVILGFLLVVLYNALSLTIAKGLWFESMLLFKIIILSVWAFASGNLHEFFSLSLLLTLVMFISIRLIRRCDFTR